LPPITSAPHERLLPLSFDQQRLWFLEQLDPASGAYTMRNAMQLRGSLDLHALCSSLQSIIQRHAILRTTFIMHQGQPAQIVAAEQALPFASLDLQALSVIEQKAAIEALLSQAGRTPFNLEQGPLLRMYLFSLTPTAHILLLVMHHIIADGWSLDVLLRELDALYSASQRGEKVELPALPVQYGDYALWQQTWLQGAIKAAHVAYWQRRLEGAPPVLQLPTDRPRSAIQRFQGASYRFELPSEMVELLRELSRQEASTLFITLLAVFKCLLSRYSGQKDIVVGTDSANRSRVELEGLVGFFVNQLVLRTDLTGNPTFRELLRRVRDTFLEAYAHQDLPFGLLVDVLQPQRDLSYNPVFQVLFSLQNTQQAHYKLANLEVEPLEIDNGTAQFDLALVIHDSKTCVTGTLEYNTDLFDQATISHMAGHFLTLLKEAAVNPDQKVAIMALLTQAEEQQLVAWNTTPVDIPQNLSFDELFMRQVERTPDAIAVTSGSESLTYQMLRQQAECMAAFLLKAGVGPDCVVAVLADRSICFLITILAIFRSGGAYLPLDPQYPVSRLQQMLGQSRVSALLVSASFKDIAARVLAETAQEQRQTLAVIEEVLCREDAFAAPPPAGTSPRSLAYVIYTSGSTGVPKGAMIEQIGMINHLYAKIADLQLQAGDSVAQTASICFDISVWQFLAALLVGGRVHVFAEETIYDPVLLLHEITQQSISIFETVPSLLRVVVDEVEKRGTALSPFTSLMWMILTGEALPSDLCQRWLAWYPHIPILNAYGPT